MMITMTILDIVQSIMMPNSRLLDMLHFMMWITTTIMIRLLKPIINILYDRNVLAHPVGSLKNNGGVFRDRSIPPGHAYMEGSMNSSANGGNNIPFQRILCLDEDAITITTIL